MDMQGYVDNLKFQLSGGILDLEIDDRNLENIINMSMREIQRYINTTKIITIPFHECIDMTQFKVSSVYRIYRTKGNMSAGTSKGMQDPMYLAQWQMMSGAPNGYYNPDFAYNYAAWNTAMQIRNTISTDMNYVYDKTKSLLYINCAFQKPEKVTIEYIPRYDSVDEIVSDYWIDKLCRLSVAYGKIALGRVRSKYTQSNALWTLDGPQLLEEGNQELTTLREEMMNNTNLFIPLD